jgi:protein ImuB
MSLSHALALLPPESARVESYTPDEDAASLVALAVWAVRFAPFVAPDPPDGLLLDVTGCELVHGGERHLAELLARAVEHLGFACRVAVAPTFGCAWAAARFGRAARAVIEPGGARRALAPLPVRSLRLEEGVVEALSEIGVDRVDSLLRLRRGDLATRFGDDLLLRLDQALGRAMETITPIVPVFPPRLERMFAGPTRRLDAVELAVFGLLEELPAALEERDAGARRLDVELLRSDLPRARLVFRLGRPSRDPRHLRALVRPRLEKAQLGFGVEGVAVEVPLLGRLDARQGVHPASGLPDERPEGERALGHLLDTLAARFDWERLRRFEPVETHLPERAFRSRSPLRPGEGGAPGILEALRPTVLVEPPEPIEAPPPDAVRFGPERIATPWWDGDPRGAASPTDAEVRDYYAIQDEAGRWRWVFRERGTGRWFLHGEWR